MGSESLITFLIVGVIAGWLAGVIVKGYGFGLLANMVVGVIGSFFGGLLLAHFHVDGGGVAGGLIGSTLGAVVLLLLIRLLRRTV
jgi:uncharacterized membrane protein YeaQ/YmgE (transglycosylase-associated protein family)